MSAKTLRTAFVLCLLSGFAAPAIAAGVKVDLTEEPEPDSKAWEDPARISLSIDPDGEDQFSAP